MDELRQRKPPAKDAAYLRWARRRRSECCVCHGAAAQDLHHLYVGGMGMKCDDYLVCPVCRPCHERVQGKGRMSWYVDGDDGWVWADMCEAALRLLADYAAGR